MTTRQLWRNIMDYGQFDRMPVLHWGGWPETRQRWISEGMDPDVDEHEYFNAVPIWARVGVNVDLFPEFDEEVIEETDEYRIFRDAWGVVKKDWKHRSSIPTYMDFTLKGAKQWDQYKKRLQPDDGRVPDDLEQRISQAEASGMPVAVNVASMMGRLRSWMGVVNMSYLMYDDPDIYAEMVDTLAELSCWAIDLVVPKMKTKPDIAFGWEDICGKNGPLVSPEIFRKCVAGGYIKIRQTLERYGIKLFAIDTDGYIEPLVQDWLDAGVNVQLPVEIGTWQTDPMELRKKFGRDLRFIGGFNKLELEKGPAAIDAEIERRMSIMADGGYVIMPDHLIPPGVSLENYKYYLDRIRELRF